MPEKPSIIDIYVALGGDEPNRRTGWVKVMAICHADRNPSVTLNEDEGKYHCWACDFNEDAYGLLMRLEGIDFATAKRRAEELAPDGLREVRGKSHDGITRLLSRSGDPGDRRSYSPSWRRTSS